MLSQLQGRTFPVGDKFKQRAEPSPFFTRVLGGHPHHMADLLKGLTEGSTGVTHFLSYTAWVLCTYAMSSSVLMGSIWAVSHL